LKHFIDVCKSIRSVLGNSDEETIDKLMAEQKEIESRAKTIHKDRQDLRHQIALFLGEPDSQASIREIEEELGPPISVEIEQLRKEIENSIAEIQSLSSTNTVLLQQTVDIFQRLIMAVSGKPPATQTYTNHGTLHSHFSNKTSNSFTNQ